MIRFIVGAFVKNSDDIANPEVRKSYGILGGIIGIVCNMILFLIKLFAGLSVSSIAVVSDAFNNLSDLGTSFVAVTGAFLGGKSADEEHPYGHGRAEYISALVIAFLIMLFGIELLKNSIKDIFSPSDVKLNVTSAVLLGVSVIIKLWMWFANRYMGKKINSSILLAAARDSVNDCVSTLVVIASAIITPFVDFPIDAIAGIGVSSLIIWSGVMVARDTTGRLLGKAPSPELIAKIEDMILGGENILGMHSLLVHDYGPDRTIASVHAEVPDDLSVVEIHGIIDKIEHKIMNDLGVDIVIHMDPVPNRKKECRGKM